jgi:hypothetical protein
MYPALILLGTVASAFSAPAEIVVEGRFLDDNGKTVAGDKPLTFEIFDANVGGVSLFREEWPEVAVTDGRYSVRLGANTPGGLPLGVFQGAGDRWLSITSNRKSLELRRKLASSPYAIGVADGAVGDRQVNVVSPIQAKKIGGGTFADSGTDFVFPRAVGVAVSSPVAALHVGGDVVFGGDAPGKRALWQVGEDQSLKLYLDKVEGKWNTALAVSRVTGNVGVGVDRPLAPLDVGGEVRIGSTDSAVRRSIQFAKDAGDDTAAGRIAYRSAADPKSLSIIGAGSTTRRIHLYDDVTVGGRLWLKGGAGAALRSAGNVQQKFLTATVPVNVTLPANGTTSVPFTWPESFGAPPVAWVSDVVQGTGYAEVILSVSETTAKGASLNIHNTVPALWNANFTIHVSGVGAE